MDTNSTMVNKAPARSEPRKARATALAADVRRHRAGGLGWPVLLLPGNRALRIDRRRFAAGRAGIGQRERGRPRRGDRRARQPAGAPRRCAVPPRRPPFRIAVEEAHRQARRGAHANRGGQAHVPPKARRRGGRTSTVAYQQQEFERQQGLLATGISSRAQFEQAQHAIELAHSQLSSAQQQSGSVLAMLGGNPDLPVDQHPVRAAGAGGARQGQPGTVLYRDPRAR
jgi:hypothetical protein